MVPVGISVDTDLPKAGVNAVRSIETRISASRVYCVAGCAFFPVLNAMGGLEDSCLVVLPALVGEH